jgi:hypothetical protein
MRCWFDIDLLFIILDEGRIQLLFNFRIERVECREWRSCRHGIGRADCAHVVRGKILWVSRALLLFLSYSDISRCDYVQRVRLLRRRKGERMHATLSLPFALAHHE